MKPLSAGSADCFVKNGLVMGSGGQPARARHQRGANRRMRNSGLQIEYEGGQLCRMAGAKSWFGARGS